MFSTQKYHFFNDLNFSDGQTYEFEYSLKNEQRQCNKCESVVHRFIIIWCLQKRNSELTAHRYRYVCNLQQLQVSLLFHKKIIHLLVALLYCQGIENRYLTITTLNAHRCYDMAGHKLLSLVTTDVFVISVDMKHCQVSSLFSTKKITFFIGCSSIQLGY